MNEYVQAIRAGRLVGEFLLSWFLLSFSKKSLEQTCARA
jgi:hypothetical protein